MCNVRNLLKLVCLSCIVIQAADGYSSRFKPYNHTTRISRQVSGNDSGSSCVLPEHPNFGEWFIWTIGATPSSSPGKIVKTDTVLLVRCKANYKLDGNSVVFCKNGQWTSDVGPCLETCPAIHSTPTITVRCWFKNKEKEKCIDAVDGTFAKFKCGHSYRDSSLTQHSVHTCRKGTWDYPPPQCLPEPVEVPAPPKGSCLLPEHPASGEWLIWTNGPSPNVAPGIWVNSSTMVIVRCNPNYKLHNNKVVFCKNGKWTSRIGPCLETCPAIYSTPTMKVTCSSKNKETENCIDAVDDTIASFKCAPFYEDLTLAQRPPFVCRDGLWNQPIPQCLRKLGSEPEPTPNGSCVLPEHPVSGQWSVVINGTTRKFSPGTLVNSNTILLVSCKAKYKLGGNSEVLCLNGNWVSEFGPCLETCPTIHSTAVMKVTCIYKNKETENCTDAVDDTLARFKCAPFYEDLTLDRRPPHICRDGSWDQPTPECLPKLVPLQDPESLKDNCILPEHPTSGRWSIWANGQSLNFLPGMLVASSTILRITCKNKYKLDGNSIILCENGNWNLGIGQCLETCPDIYSTATLKVTCSFKNKETDNCTVAVDGTVAKFKCASSYEDLRSEHSVRICRHGSWDQPTPQCIPKRVLEPESPKDKCILPEYPVSGNWSVRSNGVSLSLSPGMLVNSDTILRVGCKTNYKLDGSSVIFCDGGTWSSDIGQCLEKCPPIPSTATTKVTCSFRDVERKNCKDAVEGTIARFNCAQFYEDLTLARRPPHICRDGLWDQPMPQCVPVCGKKSVTAETLIVDGNNVTKGDYPWQVAIYNATSKVLICGGSILNQRVILTAAHCITYYDGKLKPIIQYTVVVGKYYRKYDDPRDVNEAQFSTLKDMYIPKQYRGGVQNYLGDIAVLVTTKTFIYSERVQPVCVDWNSVYDRQLSNPTRTSNGYVTGWGYTVESAKPSEVLKELSVPFVPYDNCTQTLREGYDSFLTYDKLCAGYLNRGTAVCRGDSGGGLVFKYDGKYYITGIVSLSPQAPTEEGGCDSQQYGLYTRVSDYINFILGRESHYRT